MAITEEAVIEALTNALGSPSEAEYGLVKKQSAIRRALIEYSEYCPLKKVGSFTTVIGQQRYDIGASYSYLLHVNNVFYGSESMDFTEFFGDSYGRVSTNRVDGLNRVESEALRMLDHNAQAVLQAQSRAAVNIEDDTVDLIPPPTGVKEIFFDYTLIKSLSDLKEREFQNIVDFSFLISMNDIANKRHKIAQVNEPGTGYVQFFGGRLFSDKVETVRARLHRKLGVSSIVKHGR